MSLPYVLAVVVAKLAVGVPEAVEIPVRSGQGRRRSRRPEAVHTPTPMYTKVSRAASVPKPLKTPAALPGRCSTTSTTFLGDSLPEPARERRRRQQPVPPRQPARSGRPRRHRRRLRRHRRRGRSRLLARRLPRCRRGLDEVRETGKAPRRRRRPAAPAGDYAVTDADRGPGARHPEDELRSEAGVRQGTLFAGRRASSMARGRARCLPGTAITMKDDNEILDLEVILGHRRLRRRRRGGATRPTRPASMPPATSAHARPPGQPRDRPARPATGRR